MNESQSGRGQPHSKTLSRRIAPHSFREVLECGCPPPLSVLVSLCAPPQNDACNQFRLKICSNQSNLFNMQSVFTGPIYVVRDNIDTDQIIPAQYLTLVPTIPEEYEKLGAYALCGLPDSLYSIRYVKDGQLDSDYPIVVGGRNFGCGSSREHAPIALGSAGCKVVLAESFARIFFRNCVATGELYPCECVERLCDVLKTGDVVTVDLDAGTVTAKSSGKVYKFKSLGDVRPVVDAGGLFNYARKTGMIAAK
jgi:3-isopropylmalate/(R)-2-methylmalate dehydratase small subunit